MKSPRKTAGRRNLIISYLTIRRILGLLGIALPWLLLAGSQIAGPTPWEDSLSAYYFSSARDFLVGVLCALAVFFISYHGYDWLDSILSKASGGFALLIALFPAVSRGVPSPVMHLFGGSDPGVIQGIHYVSAGAFFLLLSVISFFLFTKTDARTRDRRTERKKARDRLYRSCGIIIFGCLVLLGVYKLADVAAPGSPVIASLANLRPIFVLETAALVAFGISWIVKGEWLLRDKAEPRVKG